MKCYNLLIINLMKLIKLIWHKKVYLRVSYLPKAEALHLVSVTAPTPNTCNIINHSVSHIMSNQFLQRIKLVYSSKYR